MHFFGKKICTIKKFVISLHRQIKKNNTMAYINGNFKEMVAPYEAMNWLKNNREEIISYFNNEYKTSRPFIDCNGDGTAERDYMKWLKEFMNKVVAECNTRTRKFDIICAIENANKATHRHIGNYYTYAERNAKRIAYGL